MKKISFWAKTHKTQARICIVASFVLLYGIGIKTGILLKDLNITLPTLLLSIFVGLFLTGVALYPFREAKGLRLNGKKFYARQKATDFVLVLSTFCMIAFLGNRPERISLGGLTSHATRFHVVEAPGRDSLKAYKSMKEFASSMKDQDGRMLKWKQRKKLLREQVSEIRRSGHLTDTEKVLLVVLSVAVALGLMIGVAALTCSLSCDGSGALAALVGIGGTAAVIFLLVLVIRAIYGRKNKRNQ